MLASGGSNLVAIFARPEHQKTNIGNMARYTVLHYIGLGTCCCAATFIASVLCAILLHLLVFFDIIINKSVPSNPPAERVII